MLALPDAGRERTDRMTDATTASTVTDKPFTLADLERLKLDLEALPQPPWTLIAPDGTYWQDLDPKALLNVLALRIYAAGPFGVARNESQSKPPAHPLGEKK